MCDRVFWSHCGGLGYTISAFIVFSVPWLGDYMKTTTEPTPLAFIVFSVPWLGDYMKTTTEPTPLAFIVFSVIWLSIMLAMFFYYYLAMVSRYLPCKLVGRCTKHGLELFTLSFAVILQCFWGFTNTNLEVFSGFIMQIHTWYQLRRNPPDLGYLDLFLDLLMQVAVFACGDNKYALVATFVASLFIISYRFYYYSCPETSDLPVGNIQKLGTEKAC
ncbi:hypothetical protein SLA2020_009250 [Shorea laevis]